MSGKILPRLMAAAKEFNIGRETLVEFLVGKNFNREDLNGNVKLSDEMYHALESQFRADKVAKNKADSIEIPKGLQGDRKKKASEAATEEANATSAEKPSVTEETLSTVTATAKSTQDSKDVWPSIDASKEKSESPAPAPTPAAPVVEKITTPVVEAAKPAEKTETPAAPEIKVSAPEKIAEPIVTTPKKEEPIVPPAPKVVEEVKKETVAPKPEATVSKPASAPSIAESKKEEKVESKSEEKPTAQIGGLKVVDKIDLSSIDSSTRPKKTFQKDNNKDSKNSPIENKNNFQKQQAKAEHKPQQNPVKHEATDQKKVAPKKVSTPIVHVTPETFQFKEEKKTVILHGNASDDKTAQTPEITKIQADRLTGPKILGKIELPVDNDTRPKNKNEKRKRKRIPLDNKGGNGNNNNTQQNQQSNNNNGSGNNNNGHNNNRPGGPRNNNGNNPNGGRNNNFNRNNNGGGNSNNNNNRRGGGRNDRNNNNNRRGGTRPEEATEIDQKKIQEKIRETQAKLAGNTGNNRSKAKAKHRRERRSAQEEIEQNMAAESRVLNVTEFITVSELANLMDVSFTDIISKCMGLGIMVSINQRLDAEVIELVAGEFGYTVSFIDLGEEEVEEVEEVDAEEDLEPRNPIVTIMGHVDHGKTSLLDYVRNANVVAGEAGGITQHIGAYVVTLQSGKKITFLDTPGHEAFTAMRARGAKVTDIAVIVIAADDAVMPQTKEAISHAQAAGVPMVFAINKIDKDGANPAKIYEQLAGMNILVEEWGGKFQSQEISAKKGLNVDELLEKVLLEAEILDLKANPNREATGSIIEASLDKGRGYVATVLVQNGTLRQGDTIVSGQHYGKIKAMFNERNQRITEAGPSFPAQILGLNGAPQAGEKFKIYTDEAEAKEVANKRSRIMREQGLRTRKHITLDEIGRRLALGSFKELNIIIKGDVDGSVEALSDSLQKLSTEEIVVNVIYKAVGQISESDVLLATASDAIIVGFNVRASSQAGRLAREEGVQIRSYSIIYNAIEEIKSAMEGMLEPKVEEVEAATVEIREVYKFDKVVVAGCYVQEGKIKRDHKIKVFRDGILVYPRQEGAYAELGSLKRYKDDVKEVAQAYECGLTVKNFLDMQVGDTIVSYQEEEVKRTL